MDGILKKLGKYKYLLLVLFVGLVLILLPSRSSTSSLVASASARSSASEEETRLEEVLGNIAGVGSVSVLRSEEGVVVVCEGASSSQVRLNVTEAVMSYTGLGSDRITVLKMKTT